jgi:REP element-mobilizing transposase RayT
LELGNRSTIIFVTVCSAGRRPLFARPEIHALLLAGWRAANQWQVGRYIVMPDHIHFFCAPAMAEAASLIEWIKFWKTYVTRRWPHPEEQPIWQPDFWDRQLRSADSYGDKWDYVRLNPVRHSLVARAESWPYQGELNVLEWHDS